MESIAIPEQAAFVAQWGKLDRAERSRIRRLVRLGRPLETAERAALAVGYARYQQLRIWTRLFWLWFVPGLILAFAVATRMHPIAVGVLLALSAQALVAKRNLRRVEHVNRALLTPTT